MVCHCVIEKLDDDQAADDGGHIATSTQAIDTLRSPQRSVEVADPHRTQGAVALKA